MSRGTRTYRHLEREFSAIGPCSRSRPCGEWPAFAPAVQRSTVIVVAIRPVAAAFSRRRDSPAAQTLRASSLLEPRGRGFEDGHAAGRAGTCSCRGAQDSARASRLGPRSNLRLRRLLGPRPTDLVLVHGPPRGTGSPCSTAGSTAVLDHEHVTSPSPHRPQRHRSARGNAVSRYGAGRRCETGASGRRSIRRYPVPQGRPGTGSVGAARHAGPCGRWTARRAAGVVAEVLSSPRRGCSTPRGATPGGCIGLSGRLRTAGPHGSRSPRTRRVPTLFVTHPVWRTASSHPRSITRLHLVNPTSHELGSDADASSRPDRPGVQALSRLLTLARVARGRASRTRGHNASAAPDGAPGRRGADRGLGGGRR